MLEIKNLKKSFDDNVLFSGLSLSIPKGDFVVFSGVSGCGKTTLLNMIGGLESIDAGSIRVNDLDVNNRRIKNKYYASVVGFLFQNFVLIEDKTVAKNLGIIKKANRSTVSTEEALKRVGLSDKLNSKVYTLSGGEQQRVCLARLMIKECSLILADEPTGSLDKDNAEQVMSILESLNKDGKTVIVVTHDDAIKNRGHRVIAL
jgi:putative ABC transport system ATP-binding protein